MKCSKATNAWARPSRSNLQSGVKASRVTAQASLLGFRAAVAPVPWASASAQTTKQLESTSELGGRGARRPVLQLCGCQGGREGVLQTPKQSLADRQTDVESRKLEIKVGAVASACLAGTPHAHFQAWKSDNTEAAGL